MAAQTTYYYVVSAINGGGQSADSQEASATTSLVYRMEPVADAYVNDGGSADNNLGAAVNLTVKNDGGSNTGYNRITYLKFDVHALTNVQNAKLILTPSQVDGVAALAYQVWSNDNWTEAGITWNNQPAGTGVTITNISNYTLWTAVAIDVTATVSAEAMNDGILTIRVTQPAANNTRIDFCSREFATAGYRPMLQYVIPTNTPPGLAAITNHTIGVGVTMNVTNAATDSDLPAQTLTFSLLAAPTNATINSSSGVLTWRPLTTQANTTNPFTVMVADNGTPSLSATRSFMVAVPPLARPQFSTVSLGGNQLVLQVNGASGPDYQIQASSNLVNWSAIFTTNAPPVPFSWTNNINSGPPMNFFRVLVGPPF